jgi:hypothetical protein
MRAIQKAAIKIAAKSQRFIRHFLLGFFALERDNTLRADNLVRGEADGFVGMAACRQAADTAWSEATFPGNMVEEPFAFATLWI